MANLLYRKWLEIEKMKNPAGWQDFFAGIYIFFEDS